MKINLTKMNCILVFMILSASPLMAQNLPQLGKSPISDVVKAMTLDEKANILVGQGMYVPGMAMPGAPTVPTDIKRVRAMMPTQ